MSRAVVFAYHDVGVRCLSVLLAHGVDVALVITHTDNPRENIWFGSVAALAQVHEIPVMTPDDPNAPEVVARIRDCAPDFIFSFYYRHMLGEALLAVPARGAWNVHGSLLPKYRGRVPVNWAILHGETETGATLHGMTARPDQGGIIGRQAVPILPDDTAFDVFRKVTVAAELVLNTHLPGLLAGTAQPEPQRLQEGSYHGGRRPEDGRIDWRQGAQAIHDLVRAVAPPYPGAFTEVAGHRLMLYRTRRLSDSAVSPTHPVLYQTDGRCFATCADGKVLRILAAAVDGRDFDERALAAWIGNTTHSLPT